MTETSWKFFTVNREAWEQMLIDLRNAKSTIDLEQYIFHLDEIGKKFLEVLKAKALEGVKVRILCDAVGSYSFMNSDEPKKLASVGIKIQFYNPISPWRIHNYSAWFLRDHRKIMVVDDSLGHIGSLGIQAKYKGKDFRDTHIRFEGAFVPSIKIAFEEMWTAALKGKRSLGRITSSAVGFSMLANSLGRRHIYSALLDVVRGAASYIYITTPYFVPDLRLFRALRLAARRGVDVKILLPESTDVPTLDTAARSYFGLLMKSGVKIYLYKGARALHGKTVVVDKYWSTAGSCNLDNLSLKYNYEANVVSTNLPFAEELEKHFLTDLISSEVVDRKAWGGRSIFAKFLESISWPFHNFL